jgi:hypothetical protein
VRCYGELMRSSFRIHKSLPDLDRRYADSAYRNEHSLAYMDAIEALTTRASVIGFKLLVRHDEGLRLLRRLVLERGFEVILLSRQNLLAVYSSVRLKRKTGQGQARGAQQATQESVYFDRADFADYAERITRAYAEARHVLGQLGCRVLSLEYLELGNGTLEKRLTNFLGVPERRLRSPFKKLNASNILARFENPEDARMYLEEQGLLHWAEEGTAAQMSTTEEPTRPLGGFSTDVVHRKGP